MAVKTYSEKLKDPRWQKKRLKVFNRDKFCCKKCGDNKSTLNVHHLKYNGEPWEAKMIDLITVCEICHHFIETFKNIQFNINSSKRLINVHGNDLFILNGYSHDDGLKRTWFVKKVNGEWNYIFCLKHDTFKEIYDFIFKS